MTARNPNRPAAAAPARPAPAAPKLFTLGHSNHAPDHLLDLLRRHGIEAVADVRTSPFSRFVPHVSRDALARRLAAHGVAYRFLGRELGGKPQRGDPTPSRLPYPERIREPAFQDGIRALLELAGGARTALLCRERDPLDCHRLHLVCRYAQPLVGQIAHILADGSLEPHAQTERRLLARAGIETLPLFEGPEADVLEQAYERCALR